jgi:acetyltransferase-like isoleucine patch superfamily enzyme
MLSAPERRRALAGLLVQYVVYNDERLSMGRASYGNPHIPVYPGDDSRVRVGSFVSIGMDVVLMDGGNHRIDWVTTFPLRSQLKLPGAYADGHPATKGDIVIGNDVWIGRGARVLSGIQVGDGAVIAGYSVVTKDVRPYAIVAGNPAHEVRRRFSDDQVEALLAIAWWEWPLEKIVACVDSLSAADIDGFIARHRPAPG